ncbi:membrane lipoprotein lipid attachment site-containing protein [Corynebacterium hindlerae]|uniref:Membrane lipoprotein lipid attachment site-containing protein n=1 Tax=Corynebacterium hindlerae TaxID=699041 RepID=A0A7G5FBT5_9CORY|nr:membrane lipoprotein lipid attachment site-containing protein [Corynebacterium hindlerae]QMV84076.1 membrane lipoprotein lipid attachment site-containing protein [Corynebacterium hindlerae]
MKRIIITTLVAALALTGCSKPEPAPLLRENSDIQVAYVRMEMADKYGADYRLKDAEEYCQALRDGKNEDAIITETSPMYPGIVRRYIRASNTFVCHDRHDDLVNGAWDDPTLGSFKSR